MPAALQNWIRNLNQILTKNGGYSLSDRFHISLFVNNSLVILQLAYAAAPAVL